MSQSYEGGSSETIGFPDQTKLRNAVKMAEEVRQKWGDITRLGGVASQIQAMENIKNMIRWESKHRNFTNIYPQ